MDLSVEFRARRWRRLLNLIDGLPATSDYRSALADDDEVAEVAVASSGGGSAAPPLSEWTTEVSLLHLIADQLAQLFALTAAANSKDGQYRPPRLLPRPETAFTRARRKAEQTAYDELMHKLGKG